MKISAVPQISFKMRMSEDLQEDLKKRELKNSDDSLERYKNLFRVAYPCTEDTTILSARKTEQGDYDLFVSSELVPDTNYFVERLKKPKSLAKSLLLICNKNVEIAEKRLFYTIIKEKVRNYEPVQKIKEIADNFEKDKAEKKAYFLRMLDSELEERDFLTNVGGGKSY